MRRQPGSSSPLGWPKRCALLVAAAGLAGLLLLARRLDPDPRGFGTHTQLGLKACAYLTATGRLCPTCGMTTAFAWLVHGRIDRSWQANPAGCLLAIFSLPLAAWLAASAVKNQPVAFQSLERPLVSVLVAAAMVSVASWIFRSMTAPVAPAAPGRGLAAGAGALSRPVH
jgi:Protein of unknown function (DUF2752)